MPRTVYDEKMRALRQDASYSTSEDRFSQPMTTRVREDVEAQPVEREPSTFDNLTAAEKKKLHDERQAQNTVQRGTAIASSTQIPATVAPPETYSERIAALRRPTSVPEDVTKPIPYTHPVANERLSNIAMAGSQGPFATVELADTGKLSSIYPGDELPGGFVIEEITPEGVVVLPEVGPRQIWQRGQSQRPISTRYTQEDEDALNEIRHGQETDGPDEGGFYGPDGPDSGDGPTRGGDDGVEPVDGPDGIDDLPEGYAGYGAENIYKNDAPGAANDMAQADLNLRINDPEGQNTISSSDEPNWNNTGWTLHTVEGEDMTRYFLEKDDQVLNMTDHRDFKPGTE